VIGEVERPRELALCRQRRDAADVLDMDAVEHLVGLDDAARRCASSPCKEPSTWSKPCGPVPDSRQPTADSQQPTADRDNQTRRRISSTKYRVLRLRRTPDFVLGNQTHQHPTSIFRPPP